jgi:hypothetical protein
MPGVCRTRSLVCKGRKHTSSHHWYAETVRHSLRNGLRLIRIAPARAALRGAMEGEDIGV